MAATQVPLPSPSSPSHDEFVARHIGPTDDELARMLDVVGVASLDDLLDQTVPASIRSDRPLDLPAARSEADVLAELRDLAGRNHVAHEPDRDGLLAQPSRRR